MEVLKKHTLSILFLLIILAAIPLTVVTSQNQQTITQQASGPTPTITPIKTPPPANEQRKTVAGTITDKTDTNFTIKDSSGALITVNFIPNYTKIYQPPSAAEYIPTLLPIGIYITGTVLIIPKEKAASGAEELVGEIFHLPLNGH